jgi:hypothetical protein
MKHRRLLLIVAVWALVGAPFAAQADSRGGMGGGRGGVFVRGPVGGVVVVQPPVRFAPVVPRVVVATPSVFPRPVDPWRFWGVQRPFINKHFGHGHFANGPFFGAGVPFGYGGGYYYATAPDMTYAAPPAVAAPSPSVSMPTVVEYENGFYELRGDGVNVAYRWVWIPKVPAPPDPPPVVAPPTTAPTIPPARTATDESRKPSKVYRWTDDQGVTTYTDRLDRIPERHRAQAKANAL